MRSVISQRFPSLASPSQSARDRRASVTSTELGAIPRTDADHIQDGTSQHPSQSARDRRASVTSTELGAIPRTDADHIQDGTSQQEVGVPVATRSSSSSSAALGQAAEPNSSSFFATSPATSAGAADAFNTRGRIAAAVRRLGGNRDTVLFTKPSQVYRKTLLSRRESGARPRPAVHSSVATPAPAIAASSGGVYTPLRPRRADLRRSRCHSLPR